MRNRASRSGFGVTFAALGLCVFLPATASASSTEESRDKFTTEHFHVVTDSADESALENATDILETVFSALSARWPGDRAAGTEKLEVLLLADEARFLGYCVESPLGANCLQTSGVFIPEARLLVVTVRQGDVVSYTGLKHEAAHAFLDYRFRTNGTSRIPLWLHEGIAEYVGHSRIRQDRIELGTFCKKDGRRTSTAALESRDLQKGIRKGHVRLDLDSIVTMNQSQKTALLHPGYFYAKAWLLVDYLSIGDSGWAKDRFPRFVELIAAGTSFEQSLIEVYGRSKGEIEQGLREHVATFRTRRCKG